MPAKKTFCVLSADAPKHEPVWLSLFLALLGRAHNECPVNPVGLPLLMHEQDQAYDAKRDDDAGHPGPSFAHGATSPSEAESWFRQGRAATQKPGISRA
jgi:hypothetical protein